MTSELNGVIINDNINNDFNKTTNNTTNNTDVSKEASKARRMEELRRLKVMEFISTEQEYVKRLRDVVEVSFSPPLSNPPTPL